MMLGTVHKSPGICLTAEENPRKTSASRPPDEGAVRPVIASNGVHFLQMRLIWLYSTSGMEKEGKKEGTGSEVEIHSLYTYLYKQQLTQLMT